MQIPRFSRNFYFLFGIFFLIWMLFIDSNDIYTQYKLNQKRKNLEDQKAYYLEKITEVKQEREELFSSKKKLEKFAREKYLMKKESEDLFIIEEEE
ncbi:FtsB family cell division protein [Fulvivirga lutea]|uniref:Septum formation initiator family protein n=1 Tax=Fulvivirga lutea TaxID=2810512 RepID=A0A975A0U7_9BACT|nr:septum formation initiator family protein [Fulvivirga lutea]QSE97764.1 septum formation initiator family protein [Fulvivirga lutea]